VLDDASVEVSREDEAGAGALEADEAEGGDGSEVRKSEPVSDSTMDATAVRLEDTAHETTAQHAEDSDGKAVDGSASMEAVPEEEDEDEVEPFPRTPENPPPETSEVRPRRNGKDSDGERIWAPVFS
jgi:hypothetical protein